MQQEHLSSAQLKSIQKNLQSRLASLNGKRLLIVGDIGLDEYVTGEVRRISPEAPVPVVEVAQEEFRLGLASNVAQNVASLGGQACLLAVIGSDTAGERLKQMSCQAGVEVDHLLIDASRPTTRKLRVMTGHHHIVRVDFEHKKFLAAAIEADLVRRLQSLIPECDGIVVEDYAKGVVSESLMKKIIELAHQANKRVIVDPYRTTPVAYYKGIDLMTPNRDEAMMLSGLSLDELRDHENSILEVGKTLLKKLGSKQLIITRGRDGMSLFYPDKVVHLPTYARQVFDVTGAGDTAIATMALAWVSDFSLEEACVLANFASGVVVGKVGCVPCGREELLSYMNEHN